MIKNKIEERTANAEYTLKIANQIYFNIGRDKSNSVSNFDPSDIYSYLRKKYAGAWSELARL